MMLSAFIKQHKLPEQFKHTVERYYKPLADRIFDQYSKSNNTFFVGINGCQGSGKSTLAEFLSQYLSVQYQLNVVVMSLDDFYFSSKRRNQLAHNIHPLLATRGVPGTHNVAALSRILAQLKKQEIGFSIPRFNKATDEPFPENQWTSIEKPIDIILLEGWCWGVEPQTIEQLKEPINKLEMQHDAKGIWRQYVNEQLQKDYQPLYKEMDFWLVLQAPNFDCVYKWRLEQEQKLACRNITLVNSKVMSAEEVFNFTLYFQRLSEQGAHTLPYSADNIFYLDSNRTIIDIGKSKKD